MAKSEPALTALAGAMVGLAMAVAAVLAEHQPCAGAAGVAAGVSAGLVAGVGADQGTGPRRSHGGRSLHHCAAPGAAPLQQRDHVCHPDLD